MLIYMVKYRTAGMGKAIFNTVRVCCFPQMLKQTQMSSGKHLFLSLVFWLKFLLDQFHRIPWFAYKHITNTLDVLKQ